MRIIVITFASVMGVIALGFTTVFGLSEWILRDVMQPAAFTAPIKTDPETKERGRHIARTRGCFGCHGQQLQGKVFTEEWPWVERAVAPNLTVFAKNHSPATLEAAIRHGIGHDGKALWSMPAYNWVHLTDDDVAALIAFLQSVPVVESTLPKGKLGFEARWLIATGKEDHMAKWAEDVPPLRANLTEASLIRGEYLAMTACNECHGLDLRGGFGTPDLAMLNGYSADDFLKLMTEGDPIGERESLPLMTMVAKDRFAYFTDQEREELYVFLRSLAEEPIPEDVFWR